MMDFAKGSKSKIGAFGAFLVTLGGFVVAFVQADCFDLMCWLAFAQKCFVDLGVFGLIMKLIRHSDKKEAVEPTGQPG